MDWLRLKFGLVKVWFGWRPGNSGIYNLIRAELSPFDREWNRWDIGGGGRMRGGPIDTQFPPIRKFRERERERKEEKKEKARGKKRHFPPARWMRDGERERVIERGEEGSKFM